MLSNRNAGKILILFTALTAVLLCNTVSLAAEYSASVTGWGLSGYELPNSVEPSSSLIGVEIIDDEELSYEGRGALHIWSSGTKGTGYIAYASTEVEEFGEGKTYRIQGMIKTSQVSYGRPALTIGSTNIATSLAAGLTANEWCAFSKDFTFSGSSKVLGIQMWNIGDVYLDNLSLKEVTGAGLGEEILENVDFEKDYQRVYGTPAVIKDDYQNIIVGANAEMEYSINNGITWQAYDENDIPHFSGNVSVLIRYTEDPDKESHILCLNFNENAIENGNFLISLFKIEKNTFMLEGNLKGAKGEKVNIVLVREGKSIRSMDDIILLKSFATNEDGTFSFTAPISDVRSGNKNDGWYTLYLRAKNTEVSEFNKVYFASSGSRNDAIELLKAGNISNYFEKENVNYEVFNAMGLALSEYDLPGVDKQKVIQVFENRISELGTDLDEDNAALEFAKSIFISSTGRNNASTIYEILYKHGKSFAFKHGDEISLESVLEDADAMKWVSDYFAANPAQNFEEAESLFNEAYALYIINNATYGKMSDIIKAQNTYLKLSGTSYDEYMSLGNSERAITISKYIVTSKSKNPFTTVSMLLNTISEGVAESKKSNNADGNPGGSSGGGAGGSFGGSGIVSSGTTSPSTVKPSFSQVGYFSDLAGYSWAENAINVLFEKEIISGKESGIFAPQDTITRQEFVKMIVCLTESYDETAECDFEDVDKNAWYYKYIASAVKNGLIFGISDTSFGTGTDITREQIAVIANRILNKTSADAQIMYVDDDEVGEYAKEAVYNIRKSGIMSGYADGTFGPQRLATRAEAAVICLNILNKR